MANTKKAETKADDTSPETKSDPQDPATIPQQERPRPKLVTREDVADPDEAEKVTDPYARKPKTKTRTVDGRATLKTYE